MTNLEQYFHTDWAAMTGNDWVGLIVTMIIFCLMVVAYIHVFRPSNREKIEARRHIPLDYDDCRHAEDK